MKTRLSRAILETLEPRTKDQLIWDADLTGFYVKLTPAGRFVFMVYYRVKGRQYRRRIGAWPEMAPEVAREAAREALTRAREGSPPPERKRSGKGKGKGLLVGAFWETAVLPEVEIRFAASTAAAYRRVFGRYVKPVFGDRQIDTISPSEIAAFRASLTVASSTESRVIAVIRFLFQRALEQHLIRVSPIEERGDDRAAVRRGAPRSAQQAPLETGTSSPVEESREDAVSVPESFEVESEFEEEEWDVESSDASAMVSGLFSDRQDLASVSGKGLSEPTNQDCSVFKGQEKAAEGVSDDFLNLRNPDEANDSISRGWSELGRKRGLWERRLPRRSIPERLISGPERDAEFVKRISEIALRPDSRILSYYEPRGHICEEYRLLGKNLLHTLGTLPDEDMALGKVVVLSSAVQGEGKTLTCVNLALTLAQDLYDRVVLLDCDLRHPKIHRYLGVTSSTGGMNRLLSAEEPEAALEECLVRTEGGLHLLLASASEWNPAQLLDGESMTRLLAALRRRYSLVIVDSPPVLTATDALSVGAKSDGMLFLLRARRTQREQIQEARQRIARLEIRMLGYVINNVRSFLPQIWRKYYYGNY
jgi:capsular exopolysaccharide synthesis family protein